MNNSIRDRLDMAMKEKDITAAELSRLSGVGKNQICDYLKERYLPKQDKVYLMAVALGVDPGWLMTGDEPADLNLSKTERSIIIAYRRADDGRKEAVRHLLDVDEKTPAHSAG